MNFENIFILPNVIGDRSRRRFGGIFIKIPKVTSERSSLLYNLIIERFLMGKLHHGDLATLPFCSHCHAISKKVFKIAVALFLPMVVNLAKDE